MLSKYENSGPVDCSLPFDLNGIRGKSVLITGARSGLGYEYAKTFANAGAIVTNADIKPSSDELTLPGAGSTWLTIEAFDSLNVTSEAGTNKKEAFDAAIASSANGCIDVIIANAGISGDDPLLRGIDELEIKKPDTTLVEINLLGAMYTARLALHHFSVEWPADSAQQDKCLILKSSIMGYLDSRPSYGSTKFGVRAIMRALRHLGRCRVNVVAPWFIATPIMDENVVKTLGSQLAAQGSEFAHSDDSVNCISRIASDKSIHGRGFAIVPRSLVKEGYMDVDEDDFEEGTLCYKLQHITYGLSHRK